jgi:hypothetical protein
MLVLVFVMLFLALLGVAYRNTAAALRTEAVVAQQTQRDEGSIHALARAVKLLETGLPPASPYVCGVTITTSTGPRAYTVTFTNTSSTNWTIQVVPTAEGENPAAMPSSFGP